MGCSVNIVLPTTDQLYIAQKPNKLIYNVGEAFMLDGIKVINGKSGEQILEYTSSIEEGYEFVNEDISNNKKVEISSTGYKSASFDIKVVNYPYLYIKTFPKTEYYVNESFTIEGLVVTDKDNVVVDNVYIENYQEGQVLLNAGTFEVVIASTGYYPVTYTITVYNERSLHVDTLPTKTNYIVGEAFSSQGLIIKDERNNVFDNYSLSIKDGYIFKQAGTRTVVVNDINKEYLSTSFTVEIKDQDSYQKTNKDLKIYYVNDTHGSFSRIEGEAGISYIGQYIMDNVSYNTENNIASLVLSGGDMFQGGIESNETHGDIMIDAMNIIGFDAMALGNHEFDWGEKYLSQFPSKLNCPLLSCNVFYADGGEVEYLSSSIIVEKMGIKIGIIGAVEANIGSSITGSISDEFRYPNPTSYVKAISSELRGEGCDIVIGVFHDGGYEGTTGSPTKYESLTSIDSSFGRKYLDAMFFAHDHQAKLGVYNGVPYLEAGSNGRYVGEMTLNLEGNGYSYSVVDNDVRNINAYQNCTTSNPEIDALVDKYREQIGDPDQVLYTFTREYSREEFTVLVCQAMLWYVNEYPQYFDDTEVYFASHNTGGIRYYPIPAGEFTRRDLIKVIPFDNELCIQTCNQYHLSQMERSSYYETYSVNDIIFDSNGYTKAVTISYIADYQYAYRYQQSMIKYEEYTAKNAFIDYLLNSGETSL